MVLYFYYALFVGVAFTALNISVLLVKMDVTGTTAGGAECPGNLIVNIGVFVCIPLDKLYMIL